jgi:sorting nexin-8
MDRLVKRTEGVAADHARIALSLASLTEVSGDTYATDTNEVPLLNDGLVAMSKHLRTCQALMEDESRGWDEGVLEDLKRQRDALVSVRELFDRRERLDKDNIPYLERRIQTNEAKLTNLRSKPEGTVKAGEIDRIAESIIKASLMVVPLPLPLTRFIGQGVYCSTTQPVHLCQGVPSRRAPHVPVNAVPRQPMEPGLGRRAS